MKNEKMLKLKMKNKNVEMKHSADGIKPADQPIVRIPNRRTEKGVMKFAPDKTRIEPLGTPQSALLPKTAKLPPVHPEHLFRGIFPEQGKDRVSPGLAVKPQIHYLDDRNLIEKKTGTGKEAPVRHHANLRRIMRQTTPLLL